MNVLLYLIPFTTPICYTIDFLIILHTCCLMENCTKLHPQNLIMVFEYFHLPEVPLQLGKSEHTANVSLITCLITFHLLFPLLLIAVIIVDNIAFVISVVTCCKVAFILQNCHFCWWQYFYFSRCVFVIKSWMYSGCTPPKTVPRSVVKQLSF